MSGSIGERKTRDDGSIVSIARDGSTAPGSRMWERRPILTDDSTPRLRRCRRCWNICSADLGNALAYLVPTHSGDRAYAVAVVVPRIPSVLVGVLNCTAPS